MIQKIRNALRAFRKPADQRTLSDKILISGAWNGIEQATSIVFRIGSTLIVTRLLAPDIFGLFAVVMTVQTIILLITDFGIRSLIIIADDAADRDFLRTCWSVQIVRAITLWGIVLLLALGLYGLQQAGAVAPDTTYAAPVLPAAIAVGSFQLVLQGFESVNQHVYAKEMRFRALTLLKITTSAISPLLTIAIAIFYPNVWALVISGLLAGLLRTVLTFRMFSGPSMRWTWNRTHTGEILRRGKWIMSNSAMTALTGQADQLLLGAFLPPSLLGIYFLAKQIFAVMPNLIMKLHGSVGLQLFRELLTRPDLAMFRDRYYRYRSPIDMLSWLLAGGFLTAGPALIDLMYDPRYLAGGTVLQILAVGLPLTSTGLIQRAFAAQKRFRLMAVFGLIRALSIWLGLIVTLMLFESPELAFLVISLHRLPEIVAILALARRESWIDWREFRFLPAIGIGALLGWGVSELYFGLRGA